MHASRAENTHKTHPVEFATFRNAFLSQTIVHTARVSCSASLLRCVMNALNKFATVDRASQVLSSSSDKTDYYAQLAKKWAPVFSTMIAEFETARNQPIQGFGAEMRRSLVDRDIAYYTQVHHKHVAVWEGNRDGEMLIPSRVHALLGIIASKGWNDDETMLAAGREVRADSRGDETRDANMRLVEASKISEHEYMIAPYLPELITIASGVGSHTTAAVRLMDFVRNGGKVPVTESTQALGVDGFLNWARVIEQCPGIEAVCCLGLRFLAMCMHVFVLPVIVE